MKYNKLAMMLYVSTVSAYVSDQPHTAFIARPLSSNLLYTDSFSPLTLTSKSESVCHMSATTFYDHSIRSKKSAPYFLGAGKESVFIDEEEYGDMNSQWFNILTTDGHPYASRLSVEPERWVMGVSLRAQFLLDSLVPGLWAAMVLPVAHVAHHLHVREVRQSYTVVDEANTLFSSVASSLHWENWRKGRWSANELSMVGLDDVSIMWGIDCNGPLESLQQFYVELSVPVGSRLQGTYLFEPTLGSCGSFGIGGGVKTVAPIFSPTASSVVSYVGHITYRYQFENRQQRTFDLKGQPFSRFMIYMDTDLSPQINNVATKAANGVNMLTRDVLVTPGPQGQSMNALQVSMDHHVVTAGYLYWWRVAEQVAFARASSRHYAIPAPVGLIGDEQAWLPGAKITDRFSADDPSAAAVAAPVTDIELDLDSVALPHTASHTLFIDYNSGFSFDDATITVRLGSGYEFAGNSAALGAWHVWCGLGLTL